MNRRQVFLGLFSAAAIPAFSVVEKLIKDHNKPPESLSRSILFKVDGENFQLKKECFEVCEGPGLPHPMEIGFKTNNEKRWLR